MMPPATPKAVGVAKKEFNKKPIKKIAISTLESSSNSNGPRLYFRLNQIAEYAFRLDLLKIKRPEKRRNQQEGYTK